MDQHSTGYRKKEPNSSSSKGSECTCVKEILLHHLKTVKSNRIALILTTTAHFVSFLLIQKTLERGLNLQISKIIEKSDHKEMWPQIRSAFDVALLGACEKLESFLKGSCFFSICFIRRRVHFKYKIFVG